MSERGHVCFACGGAGGETFLHDKYAVWEECEPCDGTGFVGWDPLEAPEDPEDGDDCVHGYGCPHDPTDYDVGGWD